MSDPWGSGLPRVLVIGPGAEDPADPLGAAVLAATGCCVVALDAIDDDLLAAVTAEFDPQVVLAGDPAEAIAALRRWQPVAVHERGPAVSVVVPVHNAAEYLAETVESVLAQTFADWELVLLDDGSTDASLDVLRRYPDPRVRVLTQRNLAGTGRLDLPFNRLVQEARGELIAWLGGDDACLPHRLQAQVEAFAEDPGLGICHGAAELIDASSTGLGTVWQLMRPYDELSMVRDLTGENLIGNPSVMMRASAFRTVGRFRDGLVCDYEYWLRAAGTLRFRYLPQRLVRYRTHAGGLSTGTLRGRADAEGKRVRQESARRRTLAGFYPELDGDAGLWFEAGTALGTRLLSVDPSLALYLFELAEQAQPGRVESLHNRAVAHLLLGDAASAASLLTPAAAQSEPSALLLSQLSAGAPSAVTMLAPDTRLSAALAEARRSHTGDARRWDGLPVSTSRATLAVDPQAAGVGAAAVREWCARTGPASRVHWSFPTLGHAPQDVLSLVQAVTQGVAIDTAAAMTLDVVDDLGLLPPGADLRGILRDPAEVGAFSSWLANAA